MAFWTIISKFLKRTNWTDIVISVIFAILGILFIAKPSVMVSAISTLLGGILFIIGILKLIDYFTSKDKEDYLLAMERSPIRDIEIKYVLKQALTDKIHDREIYMKGIDHSYYYEGYMIYKSEEL